MENHGIDMKGKYRMQSVSGPAAAGSGDERRMIYNTATSINGATDAFGQYKMFYHDNNNWVRPLLANQNDGPNTDETVFLGNSSYRFGRIYVGDGSGAQGATGGIYGQVRYS